MEFHGREEMQCQICGYVDLTEDMKEVDGAVMCYSCARDYRIDHPSMEDAVAEAEWREER